MEVLSASSVSSYKQFGTSYHWFFRQLTWVAIGVPVALVASRMPHRLLRWFAWPSIFLSLVLVIGTQSSLGVTVNGNRNWLALGPLQVQPAEIAKFSLIIWCAHIYAKKEKLLGDWKHTLVPVVPFVALLTGLVVGLGGDLGTGAGAVRDHARHALGGRRTGAAVPRRRDHGQRGGAVPGHDQQPSGCRG